MTIASTFAIATNGAITGPAFVPGTDTRFTTLELHQFLQDLADDAAPTGDDNVSILGANPSELAGKRNAVRPMALTLLNGVNINDAASHWFKFGSIEQGSGLTNVQYTGLKILGSLVASSPIYIYQDGAKITKYWADADASNFQILVKAKASSSDTTLKDITVYSRKYGQTYSHFDVDLSPGGEQVAALSTAVDTNVDTGVMTDVVAKGYFSSDIGGTATPGTQSITLAYGDTTQDLGGGQGSLLHKGTITLANSVTLADVYQALMWACSESSTITFNSIPGWRYRVLPGQSYAENLAAPFGTFAGGKWFVAQGWWLTGVLAADSKNYQLISHNGTVEIPPSSVVVEISGLVSGDYVLVARDNAGSIYDTEYTVSGSSGATTLTVTGLAPDTPASGVVRINGDRYEYTSWTGTTLSGISPALTQTYSSVPAFIPMIDDVASGATISSAQMQFDAPFTCRYRVRNGGGSPIVPFESTLSVTTTGGSGTAVRTNDA
jgi:hypothetical protein